MSRYIDECKKITELKENMVFHVRKKTDKQNKQRTGKVTSRNNSTSRAGSRLEYLRNNNFDSSKFNIQLSYKQHGHRN